MTVSVEQAETSLRELIQKSAAGESIVITQNQQPVAELRSVAAQKPVPRFGSCKGMLQIIAEDDEHLADFTDYMK
jgi:antitoxin (DNA-binding transcriptional repressor) of toxin-antitoxin stability system